MFTFIWVWSKHIINVERVISCADLMIEMEDHTNDISEGRIPFLDYKTYTDRVFFLPSKDGANDVMITGKLDIPESRRATVTQALNQFSNLLNSKTFLINVWNTHTQTLIMIHLYTLHLLILNHSVQLTAGKVSKLIFDDNCRRFLIRNNISDEAFRHLLNYTEWH